MTNQNGQAPQIPEWITQIKNVLAGIMWQVVSQIPDGMSVHCAVDKAGRGVITIDVGGGKMRFNEPFMLNASPIIVPGGQPVTKQELESIEEQAKRQGLAIVSGGG